MREINKLIWKRVLKENSKQPEKGTYSDWKELIATECFNQCVYCAISEGNFGGIRNFHVEHYRPKSRFPDLINDIKNLFYACAICNVFKGNDWPNEPDMKFSNSSYPNPSETDYNTLFSIDNNKGVLEGEFIASKYMAEKLYLNRPQLILLRRNFFSLKKVDEYMSFFDEIKQRLEEMTDSDSKVFLKKFLDIFYEILNIQRQLLKLRPYEEADIKKK